LNKKFFLFACFFAKNHSMAFQQILKYGFKFKNKIFLTAKRYNKLKASTKEYIRVLCTLKWFGILSSIAIIFSIIFNTNYLI